MEDVNHFDIDMKVNGFDTTILMNGKLLAGVRSFKIECGADQISRVTLEIIGTAKLTGEGQVWVKDMTRELTDRAHTAEDRADVAEARADAAEANPGGDGKFLAPEGGTLAYIVPVEPATLEEAVVARISAVAVEKKIRDQQ